MAKNVFVWVLTVFAAFGGFLFGYDIGIINGVKEMCGFRKTLNLLSVNESVNGSCAVHSSCSNDVSESTILGLIVSVFSLGCLVGALVAGALSDWLGRKVAIMIGGFVFLTGGLIQAITFYFWMILVGRIVAGGGVGILSMVVPVYNAELAPKYLRGRLVSLNQLAITAGIMVSFLVNLAVESIEFGWRVSLGLQVILGIILIVGMIFLPETPRYLVKKEKTLKAEKVLVRIRRCDKEEVQEELGDILSTSKKMPDQSLFFSLRLLLKRDKLQRLIIGMWVQLFQQFIGMNVIMYYSTSIFCQIGVQEYASTALVGTLNFLTTFLAIVLVDKLGRKSLLLLGAAGMLASIAIAGAIIAVARIGEEEEELTGVGRQVAGYGVVLFVCLFVCNFAYGWGPIAWVVTSEIFPLNVRGVSVSITTSANWLGNFVVAMLTPILLVSDLGISGTFFLLAAILVLAFLFILLVLPETKGLSLERIDETFSLPWKQRVNILYYLKCGCPWVRRGQSQSVAIATSSDQDTEEEETVLLHSQQSD